MNVFIIFYRSKYGYFYLGVFLKESGRWSESCGNLAEFDKRKIKLRSEIST